MEKPKKKMLDFLSNVFRWFAGSEPENKKYKLDDYEGVVRYMVVEHPCKGKRKRWMDEVSDASSSEGSYASFTSCEYRIAHSTGLLRPGSRLKLKYKKRK